MCMRGEAGGVRSMSRHPEVRAKRASKDDRPRRRNKGASGTTSAVVLRGSALRAERLRMTGRALALVAALLTLAASGVARAQNYPTTFDFGAPATPEEIAAV